MNHFFSKTLNKKKFFYIIILFYFFFHLDYLFGGGILYDDWSLATGFINSSFLSRLEVNVFHYFNTRPIGGLYVALLTSLEKNDFMYILINSSLWLSSCLVLFSTISKVFSNHSARLFLLISIFPSFACTSFFSPVTQSLGVLSIFFWSLSMYFSEKKNFKLVVLFFTLSILSYETSIVLFLFNIFFLSYKENDDDKNYIINRFFKFIIKFILIIFLIILFQFLIANITNNPSPLKYAFRFIDNAIVFEEDYFKNIKTYYTKPFTLILNDIPILFIKSINHIKLNFHDLIIYLSIITLLISVFLSKKNTKILNEKLHLMLFLTIILTSAFGVFLMYMVASSVPQVNGYYNRGLIGLFFVFAFFICWLNELKINPLINAFKFFIIGIFIILNLNSMLIQKNNFIQTEKERENILKNVEKFSENKDNLNLLMIVPTYLKNNYNDETIFSEEVEDIFFAIKYTTKNKFNGRRIFYSKKCSNIINIKKDGLFGYIPSRSRKKPGMFEQLLIDFNKLNDKDLYLYNNGKFIKLYKNNKDNYKILSTHLKCLA